MRVELISNTKEVISGLAASICRNQKFDCDSEYLELAEKVIGYGHESIAEHVNFTFLITGVSRVFTHQLVRHRISSISQQSQRYVNPTLNNVHEWCVVPPTIKKDDKSIRIFNKIMKEISLSYDKLIKLGIPKEDVRFILPNATKSSIMITMNARSLWNFFDHRICSKAQWEIRYIAVMMLHLLLQNTTVLFKHWQPKCDTCKEYCGNEVDYTKLKNGTISNGKVIEYNE